MGATVGVFTNMQRQLVDEDALQTLADILKYDHSRRAFVQFMHSKDKDAFINFNYEIEGLIQTMKLDENDETTDSILDKANFICEKYVSKIAIQSPNLRFSYPFAGEILSTADLSAGLKKLLLEVKTILASFITEFSHSPFMEESLVGEVVMDVSLPGIEPLRTPRSDNTASARLDSPRGSLTPRSKLASSPISQGQIAASGKSSSPPRVLTLLKPKGSNDPDDCPLSQSSTFSMSCSGREDGPLSGRKSMTAANTFPDRLPKVLVVDDCEPSCKIMKRMFQNAGHYLVETATNGSIALDIFKQMMPSIVVVDIFMPVLGGVETIRKLRDYQDEISANGGSVVTEVETTKPAGGELISGRRSRGPSFGDQQILIIIAVSAQQTSELVETVYQAGADGFLMKPVNIESLASIISRALNQSPRGW